MPPLKILVNWRMSGTLISGDRIVTATRARATAMGLSIFVIGITPSYYYRPFDMLYLTVGR
jgi:hypothetical protein